MVRCDPRLLGYSKIKSIFNMKKMGMGIISIIFPELKAIERKDVVM